MRELEIPEGYEVSTFEVTRRKMDGTIVKYTSHKIHMSEETRLERLAELRAKYKEENRIERERLAKEELWNNSRWMANTTMKKIQEAFSEFEDMISSML